LIVLRNLPFLGIGLLNANPQFVVIGKEEPLLKLLIDSLVSDWEGRKKEINGYGIRK
jgi:hypothetical protein